ncbi:MAG: PfkB domain-containing protein [Chloroflexi bacterium OLB15]|nr:MAG: PfkB domain-containing protein [Chloroflexi bacterium OLB15]
MTSQREIIVCGQLTLDLIPDLSKVPLSNLQIPGSFSPAGALKFSAGGCVGNTSIALHYLGANVRLMACVGDDMLGTLTRQIIRSHSAQLEAGLRIKHGETSPYTIVLSPSNIDRMFLHSAGLNQSFGINDVSFDAILPGSIFHFGYPTVLPHLYADEGIELSIIMRRAKEKGAVAAMDLAMPDIFSHGIDWRLLLHSVLPHVDIFIPSLEEIVYMLRREAFDDLQRGQNIDDGFLISLLDEFIECGVAIAGVKLGEGGMILKLAEQQRIRALGFPDTQFAGKVIYQPAFEVIANGTTGAGDSAYAAFLYALANNFDFEAAARFACAAGAWCVEAPDSAAGLPDAKTIQMRIASGWQTRPPLF